MMAELQSTTNDSDVWRYIESTLEDDQKFRKNVLSRALCISEQNAYNEASIKDYSQKLINGKIESLNLTSSIGSLACTDGNFSRTFFDYFVLIMAISYGCLVAYATIQHYKHRNSSKGDGILRKFSIWYNWKKKTRPIMNEDYEKLKSIQGIRFYVIMGVLLIHTAVSYSLAFIKNTSEIEQVVTNPFFGQYQLLICLIFQRHGEFSSKHASLLIINRYLRINVVSSVLIVIYNTTWTKILQGPQNFNILSIHDIACQKNWHATLLFFNNFFSWMICATPFHGTYRQIFKYDIVIPVLLLMSCTVYGVMIYIHDADTIFRPNIRNFEHGRLMQCSGHCFRNYIFQNQGRKNSEEHNAGVLWICLFIGLPSLAVFIAKYEFKGIEAAIIGSLLKPLFVLGFGIGILGMSQNFGGVVKGIFEWEPVELLSNFTYSIYICHLPMLVLISGSPLDIDFLYLVKDFISNMLFAIFIGILSTVTIEEPGITFQKMLIPQVEKYGEKNSEKQKKK
ncbi:hypothetical protein JTB14_013654 [Gonioctena quinquepunctata]|nr:hypothetical protein JTB14_013654 [Gonioctena quinquepunctata]